MNKLYILLILIAIAPPLKSADLKHFSGPYLKGRAEYDYYLSKDGRRVFHGPFSYSITAKNGLKTSYRGKLVDGLKDGKWNYTQTGENLFMNDMYFDVNHELEQNYNKGTKDGLWRVDMKINVRKSNGTNLTGETKGELTFVNGIVTGDFFLKTTGNFLDDNPVALIDVTGRLDKGGYADGEWKVNFKNTDDKGVSAVYHEELNYRSGFLIDGTIYKGDKEVRELENEELEDMVDDYLDGDTGLGFELSKKVYPLTHNHRIGGDEFDKEGRLALMSGIMNSFFINDMKNIVSGDAGYPEYFFVYDGNNDTYLFEKRLGEETPKGGFFVKEFLDASSYNSKGLKFLSNNMFGQAVEMFDKALSLNRKYVPAYINRAQAYALDGEIEKAEKDFDKALDLKKWFDKGVIFIDRAGFYKSIKQWEPMLNDLKTLMKKDFSRMTDKLKEDLLLAMIMSVKTKEFEETLKDELKGFGDVADVYFNAAKEYYHAANYTKTLEYLKDYSTEKDSLKADFLKCLALIETGNEKECNTQLNKLEKKLPDNKKYRYYIFMSVIARLKGDFEKMNNYALEAFTNSPEGIIYHDDFAKRQIAANYIISGREESAKKFLDDYFNTGFTYDHETEEFTKGSPQILAEAYLTAAREKLTAKDFKKALELSEKGIEIVDNLLNDLDPESYMTGSFLTYKVEGGVFLADYKTLDKHWEMHELYADLNYMAGFSRLYSGNYEEAIDYFKKAPQFKYKISNNLNNFESFGLTTDHKGQIEKYLTK